MQLVSIPEYWETLNVATATFEKISDGTHLPFDCFIFPFFSISWNYQENEDKDRLDRRETG